MSKKVVEKWGGGSSSRSRAFGNIDTQSVQEFFL